jgi:hypothetical protein
MWMRSEGARKSLLEGLDIEGGNPGIEVWKLAVDAEDVGLCTHHNFGPTRSAGPLPLERSVPRATPPDGLGLTLIGAAGASARNPRAAAD